MLRSIRIFLLFHLQPRFSAEPLLFDGSGPFGRSGFLFRLDQKVAAMTETAFVDPEVVSRYFFDFEIDQSQREIALLTVKRHCAPLLFHRC